MFEKFSERIKILRNAHGLSTAQLADLIYLKRASSISNMEAGKAMPSTEVLENLISLFAVSLDWLVGISYVPYRSEISLLEENLILARQGNEEQLGYYRLSTWMFDYKVYSNSKTRDMIFSLPVRANIVYAATVLQRLSEIFYALDNPIYTAIKDLKTFERVYFPLLVEKDGARNANNRQRLSSTCYDLLQDYIIYEKNVTSPIYDIEKYSAS